MTGDTIAAIATPAGVGGVGVIRVSGPEALAVVARVVGKQPAALQDRVMTYAVARDDAGRVDDVLVVAMRGPRSYTGEDVAELHGHGGAMNMGRLLRAVLAAGARSAEAGEFTRRAFERGKIDLTRAEAVIDVIEAASERALRIAQAQLAGSIGTAVRELRARAIEALADVEAMVDFPDDDLDAPAVASVGARVQELAHDIGKLAETFAVGRVVKDGISVAIVGPVNAGKSSLFNALVGEERAIVTAEPGTTRDFVEARLVWGGVPVTLIDTAGERDGETEAERRGIELSRRRAEGADVRVIAHAAPWADAAGANEDGALHIVTKADTLAAAPSPNVIATSAVAGTGLDALREAVVARATGRASEGDEGTVVTSERQRSLMDQAARGFGAASTCAMSGQPVEIVAFELRVGVDALSEILGERATEDVLDSLFARFCIGK